MKTLLLALALTASCTAARGQLRVVDYNTAGDARAGIDTIFAAIGAESVNGIVKAPDVFALEEQNSSATTTQSIVTVLNNLFGAGTYARATLDGGTSGAGRPGMIYNTTTVQLIAQTSFGTINTSSNARQDMRYQLRPIGYDSRADFYVYASHYKASTGASNAARRNVEAQAVRANADALGAGAHIIYAGDFNIYGSSEPMWTTLTAAGAGQAFDPINRVGAWSNNSSFLDVHTQSPVTTARYGGQVTGGMDDRFDYQLASAGFLDGHGLSYIPGSYHAFGNTGTHALNGEITSGSIPALNARLPGYTAAQAGAVLTALTQVSDHLPVVADYQVPARMSVNVDAVPGRVIVGAGVNVGVTVSNSANVVAANGADALTYTISGAGAIGGSGSGTDAALGGGVSHTLTLNTGQIGAQTGTILATATSEATANPNFSQGVSFQVLDHAKPRFSGAPDSTRTLAVDFGTLTLNSSDAPLSFTLTNVASIAGLTAGLDLNAIVPSGDNNFSSTLQVFNSLAAGASLAFTLSLSTDQAGEFTALYELHFADEFLPGAIALDTLWVQGHGIVAAVPEPGVTALLLAAALGAVAVRRRARA